MSINKQHREVELIEASTEEFLRKVKRAFGLLVNPIPADLAAQLIPMQMRLKDLLG